MRLSNLVNIGPKMEELLISVGVEDAETLKELGAAKAAFRIHQEHPETIIKLSVLEGALRGTRWHNISDDEKAQLESEFNELCTAFR